MKPSKIGLTYPESTLFEVLSRSNFENHIVGENSGGAFQSFEFSFWVSSGESKREITQTVFVFKNKRTLPFFETIYRKRFAYWLAENIPEELNIQTGDEVFDQNFLVQGGRIHQIRKILTPEIRSKLLDLKFTITAQGDMIMIYKPNKKVKVSQFERTLNTYQQLIDLFE